MGERFEMRSTRAVVNETLQLVELWLRAEGERIRSGLATSDSEPEAADLIIYLHRAIKEYAIQAVLDERERCAKDQQIVQFS